MGLRSLAREGGQCLDTGLFDTLLEEGQVTGVLGFRDNLTQD